MQLGCDDFSTKTRPPNLWVALQQWLGWPPQEHLPRNAQSPANEQLSSSVTKNSPLIPGVTIKPARILIFSIPAGFKTDLLQLVFDHELPLDAVVELRPDGDDVRTLLVEHNISAEVPFHPHQLDAVPSMPSGPLILTATVPSVVTEHHQ